MPTDPRRNKVHRQEALTGLSADRPKPNTVDLRCQHDDLSWCLGAVVVLAFDGPVAHLAFDDAGVGSFATLW